MITFSIQEVAGILKRAGERKEKRHNEGREQAKTVLSNVQKVRATSLDGELPDLTTGHYKFNRGQSSEVRDSAALITDKVVRESIEKAFNSLSGLGPAEPDVNATRAQVERSLVRHAERVVAAFARGDKAPKQSVDFIEDIDSKVRSAWKAEVAAGHTFGD